MMKNAKYDLVVFGATSFVGQILTKYLSEYFSQQGEKLNWAIAGRSKNKLEEVKNSLGSLGKNLPVLIADAGNDSDLKALCANTRVVVSTVGPYALYGEPLIKACVENGTDYCDLTGETQWIKKMIETYEPQAQQSGARIVHCCGFDSVPSDMGVYYLQQQALKQFGAPATQVKMRVKTLKGGASGGTVASLINVIQEAAADPVLRKQLINPYSICPQDHTFTQKQDFIKTAKLDSDFNAWIAPFVMAAVNERVVHRSNALSGNAYGSNFSYNEAILTGSGIQGRLKAVGIVAGLGAFMFLRFFGKTNAGQSLRIKVTGDRDPGYGSTGKMLGQAAISLALDYVKDGEKVGRGGGFWTPATMFDERFIQRLTNHAGLVFEEI